MEFRHKAREHLRIAKLHFENQTYNAFPAACLELRMAIECISYELLNSFKDELDTRLAETWQPGKLIDELREIDGHVDKDITVHIGVGDAPQEMHLLGTDLRPNASWLKKSYQTLGNLVHERTIAQLKTDKDGRDTRARANFEAILGETERLLSANLWSSNIRVTISVECNCGFKITRRESLLKRDGRVKCAQCGEIVRARLEDDVWRFWLEHGRFTCPYEDCGASQHTPEKNVYEGFKTVCEACNRAIKLENRLSVVRAV